MGTGSQLSCGLTYSTAGIDSEAVPFDGGAPALTALLGNQVDTACLQVGEAREFDQLKIIAQGAGGDDWQACALVAKQRTNVFLEPFSGGPHRGKLEAILATVGPNRVVFGSNYPDGNPGAALGLWMDFKLSDPEKQAVLTTNAVRLFGFNRQAD